MKLLAAIGTWLVTLIVVAAPTLFIVLVLAGPHAGLLPQPLEILVAILGWAAVMVLPVLAARAVWRRLNKAKISEPG